MSLPLPHNTRAYHGWLRDYVEQTCTPYRQPCHMYSFTAADDSTLQLLRCTRSVVSLRSSLSSQTATIITSRPPKAESDLGEKPPVHPQSLQIRKRRNGAPVSVSMCCVGLSAPICISSVCHCLTFPRGSLHMSALAHALPTTSLASVLPCPYDWARQVCKSARVCEAFLNTSAATDGIESTGTCVVACAPTR
jgi:hypothetical protein